jgi:transcriptional regulator with XRE-family HTH domain
MAEAYAIGVQKAVGEKVRAHRKHAGMTVRVLAAALGVSPSLVSQIENGRANPSVSTLYSMVSVLGISLDELFSERGDRSARSENGRTAGSLDGPAADRFVQRAANRPTIDVANNAQWERLTPVPDPDVDFLYITYFVGGASCPPDALISHAGRAYGLLITGRLGATFGFESYELEPGDSIACDASIPHRFWSIGDEPAEVAWTVIGRSGPSTVFPSSARARGG